MITCKISFTSMLKINRRLAPTSKSCSAVRNMASSESTKSSTFFSTISTRFNSLSNTLQKQTEESLPGALKRLNDFTQTVQQRVRDLPSNLSNPLESFEAEREKFVKAKANEGGRSRGSVPVAPWEGYGAYEKPMRLKLLELSKDKRNFLIPPPEDTSFQFDIKAYEQSAKASLQHDPNLAKMRFALVPQHITEPVFWRNYFYRVTLAKQAVLSSTDIDPSAVSEEEELPEEKDEVLFDFAGDDENEDDEEDGKKDADKAKEETKASAKDETNTKVDSSKKEEVHDEYEGMEEWERELRRAASEAL